MAQDFYKTISMPIAFIALLIAFGSSSHAQFLSDFAPDTSYAINTWTDKDGDTIMNWQSPSTLNYNHEIIKSGIAVTGQDSGYVVHCTPGNGAGSQSAQWIATKIEGFNWNSAMEWRFWMGRRANNGQNGGNADKSNVWLYVNRDLDIDANSGTYGYKVEWHHDDNKDNIALTKTDNSSDTRMIDVVLLDNLSNYEWGMTVRIIYLPGGNNQPTWLMYLSTPPTTDSGWDTTSVPATTDPFIASAYLRGTYTDASPLTLTYDGYVSLYSEFATARKDAAEYTNLDVIIENPLPVELTSFSAAYRNDRTYLSWKTATETNNYGFEVERSTVRDEWETIGFVEGNGTSNSPKSYSFVDDRNLDAATAWYRLKQIDRDGSSEYSQIVEVNLAPASVDVLSNFPNPFNPATTINFNLVTDSDVTLNVYDTFGRRVRTLYDNEPLHSGSYSVSFNGSGLPSGTYIYQIETASGILSNTMLLTK